MNPDGLFGNSLEKRLCRDKIDYLFLRQPGASLRTKFISQNISVLIFEVLTDS